MKLSLHGSIALCALVLAAGGFVISQPEVSRHFGIDGWSSQNDVDELEIQQERLAKLRLQNERITRRLSMKTTIVRNLVDGRITVSEAADEFLLLNQMDSDLSRITRSMYPAPTEKESAALQVIRFTIADLGSRANDREVIARLTSQLEEMKAKSSGEQNGARETGN